jgi:hypothetical protein
MPSTKGLEFILKNSYFSRKEWAEFLEIRRELIKPLLDRLTLETLGNQECLADGKGYYHKLHADNPAVFFNGEKDERAPNLNIQGIFPVRGYLIEKNNLIRSCGLSRKGQWLWIEIDFITTTPVTRDGDRVIAGYQKATEVKVAEFPSIKDILSETVFEPKDIEMGIMSTVQEWFRIHEVMYKKLADINETIYMEYKVLERSGFI